ncbi:hypothetical protein F4820DRAFT_468292 [Hypoxylon rubiginosum]|uniref:Uncharacterized protein n=1 Tax=Hypoxylon rubiginosum TaxID=110542 RepID=A0ACB9Z5L8_9PEZI|nr:hypothetical protein F4820DRAFT_468292 [Hypoxylon rubiginosum]
MPSDSSNKRPHHDRQFWEENFQKKPNYQSRPKQASTRKVRGDPWQSLNAIQLGMEPRSFGELHRERLYLLEMLQQHDQRAIDLFKRVPIVDEQLKMAETLDEQKKAKKHRSWLRRHIGDTVEEEKNILTRLSELHVEIQCQERWHQVQKERDMRNLGKQHASSYPVFIPPPPIPSAPYYPVNAPPPFFYYPYVPYGYAEAPDTQDKSNVAWQPLEDLRNTPENNHGPGAFEMDGTPIHDASDTNPRRRSAFLSVIPNPKPKRRMSMPSLRHTSGKERDDLDDHCTCPSPSSLH